MSLKIIVADSEPRSGSLLRAVATPLGHSVLPFEDYEAAAQKGETQHFDVAFLGMRPPELTGIGVAHRLRTSGATHDAAIVMLTASDDIPTQRQAFGRGADFILTEPVQGGRLHRMLSAMNEPGWKKKKPAARLPLHTEVICSCLHQRQATSSLNISESGMLLRSLLDLPLSQELELDFTIPEINNSVKVRARIIRKDETAKLVGVEFVDLPREALNTIQVYVMGRAIDDAGRLESSDFKPRRLYNS